MSRRFCLLLLALVWLLAACSGSPGTLAPGRGRLPDLLSRLGAPSRVWSGPQGALFMEFSRGPGGSGPCVARVDSEGVLRAISPRPSLRNPAGLEPGMSRETLRRWFGPPSGEMADIGGERWWWEGEGQHLEARFGADGLLREARRTATAHDMPRTAEIRRLLPPTL